VNVNIAEPAADAESIKITLDRRVSPGGSVYFARRTDADGWPLIERIFDLSGVHSVLVKENVLIVSRAEGTAWDTLRPGLESAIRGHYDANPDGDERLGGAGGGEVDEAAIRSKVQALLDSEVNPAIASHGGFIRLVDVQGSKIYLQMGGGCQGCGMAHVTLRDGVEHMIRNRVPEVTEILDATDHASGENPYYQR
jgi:Fe-S cluster biogenesis protein NfuA